MKRKLLLIFGAFVIIILSVFGGYYGYKLWKERSALKRANQIYTEADALYRSDKPGEALDLLMQYYSPTIADTEGSGWPDLMLRSAVAARRMNQMEGLINLYPDMLYSNESAALWWSRIMMHRGLWGTTEKIRNYWEGKSESPNSWRMLEADYFTLRLDPDSAIESLESWSASGDDEVNRLLRLIALSGNDFETVENYYAEAYKERPMSAELRSSMANYLESRGRMVLARREYIAAYLLAPENPYNSEQLAEFYLRGNSIYQAIQTWREGYEGTQSPRLWWNVWFWEKMTWARGPALPVPYGDWWGNLPTEFSAIDPEAFLDDTFLTYNPVPPPIVAKESSYYWLLIFEALRRGDQSKALAYINQMPSVGPAAALNLQQTLRGLLEWRVNKIWPRDVVITPKLTTHRFMETVAAFKTTHMPEPGYGGPALSPLEEFFTSDWAWSTIVLAYGWLGASNLLQPEPVPYERIEGIPELDWLPYATVKMKRFTEGAESALAVTDFYADDVAVRGLKAELLIQVGQIESGLKLLDEIRLLPGGAGYRAAYLSAVAAFDRKDYARAAEIIEMRDDLKQAVPGLELQAKIALTAGSEAEALAIYQRLGDLSTEGLIYQFRRSIAAKDAEGARSFLLQLINLAPNEPKFREWLDLLNQENG